MDLSLDNIRYNTALLIDGSTRTMNYKIVYFYYVPS